MEDRKLWKKYLKILILSVLILLCGNYIVKSQENLIPNSGFEYGDTLWDLYADGESEAVYSISTVAPAEGNNCLKVEVLQLGSNYWDVQFQNPHLGVQENQSYRYSIKARSEPAGKRFNFIVMKGSSPYTYYADNRNISCTSDWQTYTYTFTSPVSTEDDIMVVIHLTNADATYWFDDIRLFEEIVDAASVRSDGTRIWITFTQEIEDPSLEPQITFIVTVNSARTIKVNSVNLHPQNPRIIELQLASTIYRDEDVKIDYYPGTIATKTGSEIKEFTVQATNLSSVVTEIREYKGEMPGIYPNPAEDILMIESKDNTQWIDGRIIDITGKVISTFVIKKNNIDVHGIRSGFYFIQLRKADGSTRIGKFIKK
jgi:hypothetical protein